MTGFASARIARVLAVFAMAGVLAFGGPRDGRAQSVGPPAATPSLSAAEDDKAFVIDFLEKGYLQAWFAHPSSVRQHFADPVENYWGKRAVPLNEIVQEKLNYARKWTFRFYRLQRDTVRLAPVDGRANTWDVTFSYDFMADRVPPRSSGVGETTLRLEVKGDQVKIHGESGRVVERN
jgi:hypothetical protein